MSVTATVLFGTPQTEIASLLDQKLSASVSTSIVSGFITVEGIDRLQAAIGANPGSIAAVVVGAGTFRAYEGLDSLLVLGVPIDKLFVHLGHTRATSAGAAHQFYRYHPMLHSKVYYMEHRDGSASAIIGSHNVTGFALMGLNGEAAVMLEGDAHDVQFQQVRRHIDEARSQAVQYSQGMKEAYSWWSLQFFEGLRDKTNDLPKEGEGKTTIVILAELEGAVLPKRDDTFYFEIPSALGRIQSLRAEIHLYLFGTLPASPWGGLQTLKSAKASYWCKTLGLEIRQGNKELTVDWQIEDSRRPVLKRAVRPFRPLPAQDMQQVRAQMVNRVFGDFEYLFGVRASKWEPVFGTSSLHVSPREQESLRRLDLIPREDLEWRLVTGLKAQEPGDNAFSLALEKASPEAGAYIMLSLRRREK
jgi:hypothetical protein